MPLEITTIRKIINETDEPVTVSNHEKRQSVSIGARGTQTCAMHIPWMMSAGDFTAPAPHLLEVYFDFTGNYVYFWQRDQYIMRGLSLTNARIAPDFGGVMGGRVLVIANHGAFLFEEGKEPKKFWGRPATADSPWGNRPPQS